MRTQKATVAVKPLPAPAVYEIKIPRGLPKLDGTLTRKQRVEVAMDVLALLKLRSGKFSLASSYFDDYRAYVPESGQLHSSRIRGTCEVCARGLLFVASVDRFNHFNLAEDDPGREVQPRTREEWGDDQADLIEGAFEGGRQGSDASHAIGFYHKHGGFEDRKKVMRAICRNIIENHGEFKP